MNIAIVAALISGFFAIISVFLHHYLQQGYDRNVYLPLSKERIESIYGNWHGKAESLTDQDGEKSRYIFELGIEKPKSFISLLNFNAKKIEAICYITSLSPEHKYKLKFIGGFQRDSFLKFDYYSFEKEIVQFGVVYLRLKANGTELTGNYIGFGPLIENFTVGSIDLIKTGVKTKC